MNITLSIEDEVVERARMLAKRRGKSLNEMVRDYLKSMTDPMTPEEALARLEESWSTPRSLRRREVDARRGP